MGDGLWPKLHVSSDPSDQWTVGGWGHQRVWEVSLAQSQSPTVPESLGCPLPLWTRHPGQSAPPCLPVVCVGGGGPGRGRPQGLGYFRQVFPSGRGSGYANESCPGIRRGDVTLHCESSSSHVPETWGSSPPATHTHLHYTALFCPKGDSMANEPKVSKATPFLLTIMVTTPAWPHGLYHPTISLPI